jgi:hypothetical protein
MCVWTTQQLLCYNNSVIFMDVLMEYQQHVGALEHMEH